MHIEITDERRLILASSSPRRKELLEKAGFSFEIFSFPFSEDIPDSFDNEAAAIFLAETKADQLPESIFDKSIVITADTIVCYHDEVLGKPLDRRDAIEILKRLSGSKHSVLTGVCIKSSSAKKSFVSTTEVKFAEFSESEIEYYVDNFKPFDKAGAYGIQEWIGYIGVEEINGSYFNVMGLPVQALYKELKEFIKNY